MAESNLNYVSREEFNTLKQEVQDLKEEIGENKKILTEIDKKLDVISEKITTGEKMDELKLQPLISRITKLEENQGWLAKTTAGAIIGIVLKIIFDIANYK